MLFDLRRKRKFLIVAAVVLILLVILSAIWRIGEPPEETDRIYTNVYIHGVAVGGMTREEASAALAARFQPGLEARTIRYFLNGEPAANFTFADFGASFDYSSLISNALEYSHKRNPLLRISRAFRNYKISSPPIFLFNAERMEEIMRGISVNLDGLPQNASFSREDGEIKVTPESTGYGINTTKAVTATRDILNSLTDGTVELEVIQITPLYTAEDFNFTASVLGSFETGLYGETDEPRSRNIERASERINNTVVYPGEVFSAGTIIAANSPESGYETAIVLVNGEPSRDTGGGVCQVVTTLYNAALFAELEIIQRYNHSARVSYVDLGFDATVAGDYYDLKFINNTPNPLLITSRIHRNKLIVEIYGNETRAAERSIHFKVNQVETIPPEPYREVVDPGIPRGQRLITLEAQEGYRVELIKIVCINGSETEQVRINSSLYRPLQGVIAIGAG